MLFVFLFSWLYIVGFRREDGRGIYICSGWIFYNVLFAFQSLVGKSLDKARIQIDHVREAWLSSATIEKFTTGLV